MESKWRLVHPKSGQLSLKVRETRNISVRSTETDGLVPGTPQVKVYMYDQRLKNWSLISEFTPFHHALYFLDPKQASKAMACEWIWDKEVMGGMQEPQWFNYFSWDRPGSYTCEQKQIPVSVRGEVKINRTLRLHALETRYGKLTTSHSYEAGHPLY